MTIPSGHGPGNPGVADPFWAGQLDKLTSRSALQPQPLCDSVILCIRSWEIGSVSRWSNTGTLSGLCFFLCLLTSSDVWETNYLWKCYFPPNRLYLQTKPLILFLLWFQRVCLEVSLKFGVFYCSVFWFLCPVFYFFILFCVAFPLAYSSSG